MIGKVLVSGELAVRALRVCLIVSMLLAVGCRRAVEQPAVTPPAAAPGAASRSAEGHTAATGPGEAQLQRNDAASNPAAGGRAADDSTPELVSSARTADPDQDVPRPAEGATALASEPSSSAQAGSRSSAAPNAGGSAAATPEDPLTASQWLQSSPYRFLVATPAGPVLLAVVVQIDDRPLETAWTERLDQLLARADANGDQQTQWTELWDLPPVKRGDYGNEPITSQQQQYQRQQECDFDRSGTVNVQELQMLLTGSKKRSGPMQWNSTLTFDGYDRLQGTVWDWLDADQDRRVSTDERQAATVRLEQLDLNADLAIRSDELTARLNTVAMNSAEPRRDKGESVLYGIDAKTRWPEMLYALEQIYALGGSFTQDAAGQSGDWFTRLDKDGDGELNVDELAQCAVIEPDLLVVARYPNKGKPSVQAWRRTGDPSLSWASSAEPSERCTVIWRGQTWEWSAEDRAGAETSHQQAGQLVDQSDRDKNDYLSPEEFGPLAQILSVPFERIDADGNQMVTAAEIEPRLAERMLVGSVSAEIEVAWNTDPWGGWDANGDGLLGQREWQSTSSDWSQRDADHDDMLEPNELAQGLRFTLQRGSVPPTRAAAVPVLVATPPGSTEPADWFQGMDANRDREISRSEFWGTDDAFQRLDRDKNRYLSRDEVL